MRSSVNYGDKIVARYTGIEGKKGIDFSSASEVGDKVLALYDEGEFDVCTICLQQVRVRDFAGSYRPAAHPVRR
ncbi:MAG: hypothetical protein ACFHHU_17515 [Porticoccaceae bacterium]